ncbi:MAG TPA: methyltransferase domain-containing protein [Hyphomicrobiaceae bacterium]|nr:methyltransferase domain-containing protein [Hyphomicrobiaceae bacterium]
MTRAAPADNYCIKAGYVARTAAVTIETTPGDYWTPQRIHMAAFYQFEVYRRAAGLIEQHGLSTVLDLGAGYPGKIHLLGHVSLTLVDQATLAPIVARDFPYVEFIADDLERPGKLGRRSFDLVICADVLEHLMDPDPCMELIRSAAKRFAVLSTPERDVMRGTDCMASPKPEHVREWNAEEFRRYVESRGFNVVSQELLPQGRLSRLERVGAALLGLRGRRWTACQMIVCQPRVQSMADIELSPPPSSGL